MLLCFLFANVFPHLSDFCHPALCPVPAPSDSWLYPLTDSSYDSVENELDNGSGGSPGFCSRRHLRPKAALQGSLDSILTFSDYDQDADPDVHPPGRTRGRSQDPDLSRAEQDTLTVDTSSLDLLSPDGRRRRRSEPAIAYRVKFGPCAPATGADEELSKKPSSHTHSRDQTRRGGGESAAPEASSPSLSSAPNSPAPTRSSLDSLESLQSLSSEHTWATRREFYLNKTHAPSNSLNVPSSTSTTVSSPLTSGGQSDPGTCPKDSPPKESLSWGTLKGCIGLHPNSWLKKGRRLSLTQQDNSEKEEEDRTRVSKIYTAKVPAAQMEGF